MSEAKQRSNLPAPALPRENFKAIKECRTLDELFSSADFRERIVSSVPNYMTNERMLSVVLRAHVTNPLLVKATPQSFAGACLTATNTGLEPNSALAEAHLIPFRTTIRARGDQPERELIQIQVIFGYSGLLKLVSNTGRVLSVSANVVYPDADVFDWMEGSDTFLKFKRGGRRDRREGDQPGYAYFHARLTGGGESMEVWPYGDVLRIRNLSQAFRRAKKALDDAGNRRPPLTWTEAPWVKWEEPMARKTMIRAGTKYLPKSVELANAVRLDEMQDRRDVDYSRVIDLAGNAEDPDYAGAAVRLGEQAEAEDEGGGGVDSTSGGGGVDPGAAFADRRPQQPTPTPHATGQQSAANDHPASTAGTDPGFEHYLIDEAGDYDGPFVDPIAWAKAFIALHARTKDMVTFLENNEQALADARRAPIADQLLAVTDENRDLPPAATLAVVKRRDGKDDWADYSNGFRHVLFGWRGDLPAWLEMQRATMQRSPLATKLLLVKMVRERCEQLRVELPGWIGGLITPVTARNAAGAAPDSDPDPDEPWVRETIAHIRSLAEPDAIRAFAASGAVQTVMRRLNREKRLLWDRVDAAVGERLDELEGAPDPGEAA